MSKKDETRTRIMSTALQLFSEQGYTRATTKQIAEKSNVNEITLFRHFGNKETLFQETLEYYVEEMHLNDEIERLISQDFEKSMSEIAADYLEYCKRNKSLYLIQMRLPDNMEKFVKLKMSRGFKKGIMPYFIHLESEGMINGDPEKMASTFINSILGAYTIYLLSKDTFSRFSIDELVQEHARQFVSYYRV
ncbi:TetR/AcrR family transcriptional regulator [Gottschalkiaceae bacterium SANA]|nr:TetR/AcrR family transcriptional regulator [Gottschalkiaceae bacterium SANA]